MMNATKRMDGHQRATVRVEFAVHLNTVVVAAAMLVEFNDVAIEDLTQVKVMNELRTQLSCAGSNFEEFGHEQLLGTSDLEEVTAKVLSLFPSFA